MRKRYGSWTAGLLAVLAVLVGVSSAWAQNPKFYPTLSLRNWRATPDGILRVPQPPAGGTRYFLVPVYIYNEVDTTFNPNPGGQHLEPIRSFEFQLYYHTQAMVLDTMSGTSPIVMVGPDPTAQPALAKTFFTQYSEQPVPGSLDPSFHVIRISGASSVPLAQSNFSDSGYTEKTGVLLWVRFKVVVSDINQSLMQLDTSRFNDHPGDSLDNVNTQWLRGNFGGGTGVAGRQNTGQGLVYITPPPSFVLLPFSQITTSDNVNYQLVADIVYDPSNPGIVSRQIQVRNGQGNTDLTNVTISSNQQWLNLSSSSPTGGQQSIFFDFIHFTSSFGSEEKNVYLNVNNPDSLAPGIYYATVTLSSDGASNSPAKLLVRFVRLANPNEPGLPGQPGTGKGIRLNITNGCTPSCTNTITFGTGAGATVGQDVIYGEQNFTTNDKNLADTNVNTNARCFAYFEPLDQNVVQTQQAIDPNFLGFTRDIRSDKTDTTLIYKVVFSTGNTSCGYPIRVCVDPSDFPAGARIVLRTTLNGTDAGIDLRNATVDPNGTGMRCVTIQDAKINAFYIEYTPGAVATVPTVIKNNWNLISLPVIPPDPSSAVIFPNAAGAPYTYSTGGLWQQANTLEFGRGYMIKYGSYIGNDALVAGTRSNSISNVRIDQGWNSVGAPSIAIPYTNISLTPLAGQTIAPTLQSDLPWEFVPTVGYRQTSTLVPGKGYFIKVDQPGYYNTLPPTTAQTTSLAGKAAQNELESLHNALSTVTITDARNNGQQLYFGNANTTVNEARYQMPPMTPALDARFDVNAGNVSVNHASYVVDLRAQSFPLTLNFNNLQGDVVVRDMNGNVLGTATNGGSITIKDANIHQIEISQKQTTTVPATQSYNLEQNAPNPFAGVTSISFSIPQEQPVSLVVYNQLGEVVATVVNQVMGAGQHEVTFDGSNLSNGTYYYTLRSGSFVKTEHMTIAR